VPDRGEAPDGRIIAPYASPSQSAARDRRSGALDLGQAPRADVLSRAVCAALELFVEHCRERGRDVAPRQMWSKTMNALDEATRSLW